MTRKMIVAAEVAYLGDDGDAEAAVVYVGDDGKISRIDRRSVTEDDVKQLQADNPDAEVLFVQKPSVLLPGVVDSHVHINEPGRTDWEGFDTATRAAAKGGVTTVADMPLNSIPPTTTMSNLAEKTTAAKPQVQIDVAFWGGVVPDNAHELEDLVTKGGVCGFKCFLIHSGVDEFPAVNEKEVRRALKHIDRVNSVLIFHAEQELCSSGVIEQQKKTEQHDQHDHDHDHHDHGDLESKAAKEEEEDVAEYATFLNSRPKEMENTAIDMVIRVCRDTGVRCHIVHLSSADAIEPIRAAKKEGLPLTVETCFHYLYFRAEDIPRGVTKFKCCPPIRDEKNREALWAALQEGVIDMVVSDHSPCTENLKVKDDFMSAWGGISSMQFGLCILYTLAQQRGISLRQVQRWISVRTAELIGLADRKGQLEVGFDADMCVFDPTVKRAVRKGDIAFKNKVTPYEDEELLGLVQRTIVRGRTVFVDDKFVCDPPHGSLLHIHQGD
eukprot:TRINITY_DN65915_c12_g1_i1.p1 TRINITY_DN65915_c12_g1~~TRINITY_DN65915_c12_g1_i1.p1  ORF type:complete len:508 (+),score=279.79 TRINITY_DN65915_c12_g1_i1:34-1524(+)